MLRPRSARRPTLVVDFDDLAVVYELEVGAEAQDRGSGAIIGGEGEVGVAVELQFLARDVVCLLLDGGVDPLSAILVKGAAGNKTRSLLFGRSGWLGFGIESC